MALENLVERLDRNYENFVSIFPHEDMNIFKILTSKDGGEKAITIYMVSDFMVDNSFNSYHCFQIVAGADWKDKIYWIINNYEDLLKPMDFNGYHVSQIVTGKEWQEKLEWIVANLGQP